MNRFSLFRSAGVLLGALIISSCLDSGLYGPTAPISAVSERSSERTRTTPSATSTPTDTTGLALHALWWRQSYWNVVSASKTIDASGGTISIPETGLTVSFPQGALTAPLKITVTADAQYVAYKFEPAGTTFLKDVTVTQLLNNTTIFGQPLRNQLYAAYIADDNQTLSGTVRAQEIEPSTTIFSPDSGLPQAQVWIIRHFSRYMLASG
jgi:ZU5 domain